MAGEEKNERWEALAEVIETARDRHVTYGPSILNGFLTATLDCQPYLVHPSGTISFNPRTMQPILYTHRAKGFQVQISTGNLFTLKSSGLPEEDLDREPDFTDDKGNEVYAYKGDPFEFTIEAAPVVMTGEDGKDIQCSMMNVLCGLALHDAQEQGPDEVRRVMGLLEKDDTEASEDANIGEPALLQDTNPVTAIFKTLSKTTICITTPSANQHLYKGAPEILPIDVGGKNEGQIPVIVTLDYDGLPVETRERLTRFDKVTIDTVATMWENGNRVITAKQIAQKALHKKQPSAGMVSKFEESINKMMFTRCHIDASAEARGKTVTVDGQTDALESFELNGPVINAYQSIITTQGGLRCEGYVVLAPPLPYVHDKAIGQITSYPPRLAEAISGAVSMNETTLVLRDYLIQRVARMKHAKRQCATERRIRYETICEQVGIEARGRTELKRMRETVEKILEAMKCEGYILDYEQYKDGKSFAGVEIRLK